MKHEKAFAYAAFATVCIVWGTTYLAIRIAIETIPPLLMTAFRFTVAGVIMLAIARWRGEQFPRSRAVLGNLALIGFLMVAVGNLSVVWAEQWVPSGMAALFVATAPFWMAIIEAFRRGGERLDVRGTIGMLIGFAGVAMLVTPGGAGASWGAKFLIGGLAIQLGGFCWQFGTFRGKYYTKGVPLFTSSGLQMLIGGLIVGIVGFAVGEGPRFHVTPKTFGALLYLTLFGSVIAYSAYVYALAHIRTTKLSLYAYINPAVAVLLGWLILDEQLTWVSVLAMVVILGGVALVQSSGWKRAARPVEPAAEKAAA